MAKPPKKIAGKLVQTSPAKIPDSRVVTTHTDFVKIISYQNTIKGIPNCPERLAELCGEAIRLPKSFAYKNFASSRDAANCGDPLVRYFRREKDFNDLAIKATAHFAMRQSEIAIFRSSIGLDQRKDIPHAWVTAANPVYRAAFGVKLRAAMRRWAARNTRECHLITIIKQTWHCSRQKPKIDIAGMKAEVDAVLASCGWEGFLIIEIQGMRAQAMDLHPHLHGIIRPMKKGAMDYADLLQTLWCAFPHIGDAKGVDLQSPISDSDVTNFLLYAAKSPSTINRLYTDGAEGSPIKTREGVTNYSSRFALDILEIRSMVTMDDLILTRGKGFDRLRQEILSDTAQELADWGITVLQPDFATLAKVWAAVRRRNPEKKTAASVRSRPIILRQAGGNAAQL